MARKGFLNSEEINTLVFSCFEFGVKFPVYFPDVALTRKIHELVFDVPAFSRNIEQFASSVGRRGIVSTMQLTWKVLSLWVFGKRIYS